MTTYPTSTGSSACRTRRIGCTTTNLNASRNCSPASSPSPHQPRSAECRRPFFRLPDSCILGMDGYLYITGLAGVLPSEVVAARIPPWRQALRPDELSTHQAWHSRHLDQGGVGVCTGRHRGTKHIGLRSRAPGGRTSSAAAATSNTPRKRHTAHKRNECH